MILNKKFKILLLCIVGSVLLIFAINVTLAALLKSKINNTTNKNWGIATEKVNVNVFTGKVDLDEIELHFRKQKDSLSIRTDNVTLSGVYLWDMLSGKNWQFSDLHIRKPKIYYYTGNTSKDNLSTSKSSSEYTAELNNLNIENAEFFYLKETDTLVHIDRFGIKLSALRYDAETQKKGIPFTYTLDTLAIEELSYQLNSLEKLKAKEISGNHTHLTARNVQMIPTYDKVEFQKHIKREKDRITLQLMLLEIENYALQFDDEFKGWHSKHITFHQADLELYRNKSLPDQITYKPLYSEMLRKLPFHLKVDTVSIKNSKITYQQQLDFGVPEGTLVFDKLSAKITGLNNAKSNVNPTTIGISCTFMENASLSVEWDFKIANPNDDFTIKGYLKQLDTKVVNSFLVPNSQLKLYGDVHQMYFNFYGNNHKARGEMRMAYDNFKVELLKGDKNKVGKLLSSIANIFIDKDNTLDEKKAQIKEVTRNPNKSFFNYLWLCVRKGAIETML